MTMTGSYISLYDGVNTYTAPFHFKELNKNLGKIH